MLYRKKPVVVEAEPYHQGVEDGFSYSFAGIPSVPFIDTLEGRLYISPTDYIITGVDGERYPCKKEIFEQTYEPVKGGRISVKKVRK